jgi:hypothetical protein
MSYRIVTRICRAYRAQCRILGRRYRMKEVSCRHTNNMRNVLECMPLLSFIVRLEA